MNTPYVWFKKKWALKTYGALSLACCGVACTKAAPHKSAQVVEQSSMMMEEEDPALSLFDSNCSGGKDKSLPVLYAHFLETTLKDEIGFTDVIDNKSGSIICAPGPFVIEQKNRAETAEGQWAFTTMPAYFVWHLEDQSLLDQRFYLTSQNGMPMRSQVIKLQRDNNVSLVLFPKTELTPGTLYYIYLTTEGKEAKKTFIQPIVVNAAR